MTSGPQQGRVLLRRLLHVGQHAGAHRVAARAAVSVLVPLLALQIVGHPEWSIYAAFGAFTSLYGRERVDLPRLVLQATAGLVLAALVTLGAVVALSPARAWLAVLATTLIAVGATYLSFRQHWHPPGPLFPVFAFSAVASVPDAVDAVPVAAAVSAASAVFSLVVGNAGALVRRVRRTAPLAEPSRPIGGSLDGLWRQAVLSGTGVALAGSLATAIGIGRPYWAMVGAVVPLAARTVSDQFVRGAHRLVGTFLGLGLAWLLLSPDLPGPVIVVIAALLQAGAELLVGRNYALALICITPLALVMVHLGSPVPVGQLLVDRGLETVIGVVIGMLVGYVGRSR